MKKLLTLALALALVFAIAAPAMAITGDIGTPTPQVVDFVNIDVALFTTPYSNTFGFQLSQVASNKLYVVNEMAFWGAALKFEGVPAGQRGLDHAVYDNGVLRITSDAITLNNATQCLRIENTQPPVAWGNTTFDSSANELTYPVGADWYTENDYTLYVFGNGMVKAKGILRAELRSTVDVDAGFDIYNGLKRLYNVVQSGEWYTVIAYDTTTGTTEVGRVGFHVISETCDRIDVAIDGAVAGQPVSFVKDISAGGALTQYFGTIGPNDPSYSKYMAVYNRVMSFFGFDYFKEGYLRDKHFESKASNIYLKDEAPVNLYTGSIVIPNPDVTPPKTGDAASLMGFAMIALALAAMGFVVSRRVRA